MPMAFHDSRHAAISPYQCVCHVLGYGTSYKVYYVPWGAWDPLVLLASILSSLLPEGLQVRGMGGLQVSAPVLSTLPA